MENAVLAALGERNRLRIVELLNAAPRPVGEIADELGLRQPQVTKHLQALQRAGLVTGYPLGHRRIYALRREPLRELGQWLEAFKDDHPSEHVLVRYAAAISGEQAAASRDPEWAIGRRIRLQRQLPAQPAQVWAHWTDPLLVRQWWSPEHFDVAECEIDPVVGGRLEIVMTERGGGRYPSEGRFLVVTPPRRLRFQLSHLKADGWPLFTAIHELRLADHRQGTRLNLAIRVASAGPAAATAVAGIRPAWEQMLGKLARTLARLGRQD